MNDLYQRVMAVIKHHGKLYGYAIALHGSKERDLDLIACPWTNEAMPADDFFGQILYALKREIKGCDCCDDANMHIPRQIGEPEIKPHGRVTYTILLSPNLFLDFSIMPRDEHDLY